MWLKEQEREATMFELLVGALPMQLSTCCRKAKSLVQVLDYQYCSTVADCSLHTGESLDTTSTDPQWYKWESLKWKILLFWLHLK
jgi:hypothetical protein